MNSSKSEDSTLASDLPGNTSHENRGKALAGKVIPTFESVPFSRPVIDKLNGVLPDFNKKLSPERDLKLSPPGNLRLSPETLPRLVSNSSSGFETAFPAIRSEISKTPVGKGLEVKPDLAGRTLSGASLCSLTINADLPIAPLGSRFVTLRQTEDRSKKVEKEKKIEK
ncbi:MAG TPA: hypothetical protein VN278_01020 [Methanosarcina sp.]|nr:hypothetical protein [Methanosarcina sp.]